MAKNWADAAWNLPFKEIILGAPPEGLTTPGMRLDDLETAKRFVKLHMNGLRFFRCYIEEGCLTVYVHESASDAELKAHLAAVIVRKSA